ncbi:unnamed protein product [Closterium sp. Yama58-4]|nr:unnamed protein product [Closterium sp. Yama58-4]
MQFLVLIKHATRVLLNSLFADSHGFKWHSNAAKEHHVDALYPSLLLILPPLPTFTAPPAPSTALSLPARLDGVVDSVTTGGYVVRDAGGQMHEVRETRVRRVEESEEDARRRAQEALAAVEREADETRRALKRKMEEASRTELVKKEIPLKLRIKPEDSEDVRAEKKRKIHAFKSKQRMEMLEVMTNKKQNTWQQFQTKGIKKKVCTHPPHSLSVVASFPLNVISPCFSCTPSLPPFSFPFLTPLFSPSLPSLPTPNLPFGLCVGMHMHIHMHMHMHA